MQDARYAWRTMRRSPGFTAVVVLSLALGIGANTAIFSLLYTVMLRALPVAHPEQLVEPLHRLLREGYRANSFTEQAWQAMRDRNHVLSMLLAASPAGFHLRGEGIDREKVDGAYVSSDFFAGLGLRPAIGRWIASDGGAVAVLSWAYWNSRFHRDAAVLGRRIFVDDMPVTIVGVCPREFVGWQVGAKQDLWLPLALGRGRNLSLQLAGRLRRGVSLPQAHAELALLDARMVAEQAKTSTNPFTRELVLDLEPAGAGLTSRVREQYSRPLAVLMAMVAVLLLLACANVASLLLARGMQRLREMSVRVALGASRTRLLVQMLIESVFLSEAGALIGVLLAYFGTTALARIIAASPGPGGIVLEPRPDAAVLLFTVAIGLATGLLFGIVPAIRASGVAPAASLRETGRSGETRFGRRFGRSLIAAQVALSVMLLSAAGLFVRHLADLKRLDLGFRRDHVLLVALDAEGSGYDAGRLSRAYADLIPHVEAIPGVRSATLAAATPISGAGASRSVTVEGYQAAPGEIRLVQENWVAPKYFETLGTPLLLGRDFDARDPGGPRVAIVDQTMARYYFGAGNPIGKHVTFDGDQRPYEIVGVAADAKYIEMREPAWRTIYLNTFQEAWVATHLAIRTSVDPASVAGDVRRTVRAALKTVSAGKVITLADQVDASLVPERLIAMLSAAFGALGALLAAIGLYGLLAYTVARRTNEIGIRIALGATRRGVTRMVLADALAMVTAGVAMGALMAFWTRSLAVRWSADLPVHSAFPIVFGALANLAVAALAAYLPARRAARVEPLEALRYE